MSTSRKDPYLPEIRILELPKDEEEFLKELGIPDGTASRPAMHMADLMLGRKSDASPRDGAGAYPVSTVVIEDDYVDQCHQAAYARAYARAFRYFERDCRRMHFFASRVSKEMLREDTTGKLQAYYRGFCVLRNRPRRTLGRMVVSPPGAIGSGPFPFRTGFGVNLAGHALEAFGVPFLQRDHRVAACATAAIWMALSLMASSLQTQAISSLTDISDLALGLQLGFDGRPVNRMSLETRQIEHAINRLGFNCTSYMVEKGTRVKDLLCKYLDSGIAPILYVYLYPQGRRSGHAVAAVGYRPAEAREFKREGKRDYMLSSELVNEFLVHDDRQGAYLQTNLQEQADSNKPIPVKIAWDVSDLTDERERDERERERERERAMYSPCLLRGLTVPLPPRVSLVAEKAEAKAWAIIRAASDVFSRKEQLAQEFPTQPVLRTYLVASNDYKEKINPRLGKPLTALYKGTHMPRYVWVTEVRCFAVGSTWILQSSTMW